MFFFENILLLLRLIFRVAFKERIKSPFQHGQWLSETILRGFSRQTKNQQKVIFNRILLNKPKRYEA